MTYEFVGSKKEGRTGIRTPYNQEFVNELKLLVPSAKWSGQSWFFDDIAKCDVETLAEKYWPKPETFQTVRIEWDLNRDDPQVDGVSLAHISRDNWSWRSDCPVKFKVLEATTLESGGSRKSPGLYGNLIIETKIRPGAKITPEPEKLEVIENGTTPNPLEKFSDEDLLAELKRRGLSL